jgi:two-component system KDP operon response regulator KdpE
MFGRITILLIDSNSYDLSEMAKWLEDANYETVVCEDIRSALPMVYEHHPDAIVCALDIASRDEWKRLQSLRDLEIPIILIAVHASRSSLEAAFEMHLAGYLVKPLQSQELVGRLEAVVGQGSSRGETSPLLFRHESLTIDWKRLEVRVNGRLVHLSRTEFKLLSLLVRRRGWVLTFDEILANVWGSQFVGDKEYVKLYIWYLRRKLEADPSHPRWILTKRGIGYTFADEYSTSPEQVALEG